MDKALQDGFRQGQPEVVYELTRELTALARLAVIESAEARFKVNFGSPLCDHCDGLKVGPGVVATCFQVKRCFYNNIKEVDATTKQQRVISSLLGGQEKG